MERKTIIERYDQAAGADEIVVLADYRTSADYLLAAAYSQAGSKRNRAAVSLHRLQLKISSAGVDDIRQWAVADVTRKFARPPHELRPKGALEVFEIVLHWYLEGVCPRCDGRKFALAPGSTVGGRGWTSATPCDLCDGLGREPVHHRLPRRMKDPGRYLADQFGDMLSFVEAEMGKRLRG